MHRNVLFRQMQHSLYVLCSTLFRILCEHCCFILSSVVICKYHICVYFVQNTYSHLLCIKFAFFVCTFHKNVLPLHSILEKMLSATYRH